MEKFKDGIPEGIQIHEFLKEMHYAYGAADIIISRAGASSISELCVVGKPTILVPSPNVAEDHQTKNAMALVDNNAAIMVKDAEARNVLSTTIIQTLSQKSLMNDLSNHIIQLAKPEATKTIVEQIQKILENSCN